MVFSLLTVWFLCVGLTLSSNVTIVLHSNNIKGEVGNANVRLLGVFNTLTACEQACYQYTYTIINNSDTKYCESFTWHHTDFVKPQYQGHCYAHIDALWAPVSQEGIDSGCRNDVITNPRPNCSVAPPSPPIPHSACASDFECSGGNGVCLANATCQCKPSWTGTLCSVLKTVPNSARVAYTTPLWTWGGTLIEADDKSFHLFTSVISNNCGILHYCVNSEVHHYVCNNATGPFAFVDVALAPRATKWDNGAVHGVSVHRLPNKTYVLLYMGTLEDNMRTHPNCTAGSNDSNANTTFGSHNGRRIGIASSASLNGPWQRFETPLFRPATDAWDNIDVSNPAPIISSNGSVIMLYKGRGKQAQHMGIAYATSIDGPYVRNNSGVTAADLPGEDPWGWIDDESGIFHAVFHTGNGVDAAGTHCWSKDGVHWFGQQSEPVYTGRMEWASDTSPPHAGHVITLSRRERPQILLAGGGAGSSYGHPSVLVTSAEDCTPKVDGGLGAPCAPGSNFIDRSYTALVSIQQ